MLYDEACNAPPIASTTQPIMIEHRRPSRSPKTRAKIAPKKQPIYDQVSHRIRTERLRSTSYIATTVPCSEELPLGPISGKVLVKALPVSRPPITPLVRSASISNDCGSLTGHIQTTRSLHLQWQRSPHLAGDLLDVLTSLMSHQTM